MATRATPPVSSPVPPMADASCDVLDEFSKNIIALQLAGIGIRDTAKGKPLTGRMERGPWYDEESKTAYLSATFIKARVYLGKEKGAPQQPDEWWMDRLRKALAPEDAQVVAKSDEWDVATDPVKATMDVDTNDEDVTIASPIDDQETSSDNTIIMDGYGLIMNLQTIRDARIDVNVDLRQAPVLLKSLPDAWLRIGSGYVPDSITDEKLGKRVAWFNREFLMSLFRMNRQAIRAGTCMPSDWQEQLCKEMRLDIEELMMYREMGMMD